MGRMPIQTKGVSAVQWISVKDELPPEGEDVLCFYSLINEMHVMRYWYDIDEWRRPIDHDSWIDPEYWAALPEPPEDK